MQRLGSGGPTAAPRIRVVGLLLLAAHLVLVGWMTLRPLSVPWVAPSNLHPLATIRADLAHGPRAALEGIGGGLLLLAPFGVLLPLATGRLHRPLPGTCARTVFAGAMVSALISLVQTAVPGQVVDVDSVLLNSAGIALAAVLVFPLLRRWLLRHDRGNPAGPARPAHPKRAARVVRAGGASPARARVPLRDEAGQGSPPRATRVGMAP